MACPFFEPQVIVRLSGYPGARLPLIEEYEGACHAGSSVFEAPGELRFQCCNHGYSRGKCPHFPQSETRSAVRFDVVSRSTEFLELLCVEEQDHAPLRWLSLRYAIASGTLEPVLEDICAQAQAQAFCRSFLRRFAC
ncbi:MAG TPA: hypothetical protein VH477_05640 [Bryobacteraceae bacterium]|jgi:hypothetical protein